MADTVTVKKGDTLSAIAKAAGTTVKAIQSANPQITNANLIKPGQVFTIPGKAPIWTYWTYWANYWRNNRC